MNGEYYLVDKTATGTARVWKHKDYESVIRVVGTPIQYWAICPTATSTNYDVFIPSMEPKNSPYDESTLGSLTWNYRGSGAAGVSVVAQVVSGNSGDSDNGSGDDSSGSIDSYVVSNCGTVVARGTYVYAGEHNNKPYYIYTNPNNSVTYYLSYRSDTSGWGITVALTGSVTPLYYQSTVSETPDDGVYGVATGISPAPTIVKGSSSSDSGSGSDTSYAFSISGITDPVGANGNYIEQSTGVYKHETNEYYVSRDSMMAYWCLSPTVNPSNPGYANFYGNGSHGIANPWEVTAWTTSTAPAYPGTGTLVITKGGSSDTPSDGEIISYVVSGAGSPEYDGTYTYLDEYNGYPRYSCLGGDGSTMMYIQYNPALQAYIISAMANTAYQCSGTDITGTWTTNMANGPAPTVTKCSSAGGNSNNNLTSTVTGYSVIGAGTKAVDGVYTLIDNTENNEKWSNGTYNLSKMYTNVLGEATTYYIYPISAGLLPSAANHTYYGYKSGGNYKANEVTWSVGTGSMAGIAPIPTFTPIYDESGGDSENARNFTITISGTPTIDVSGTYFEQNPGTNVYKHESKEYYVYKCSADGTYVVSDNLNCQAMVQGIWYTNTIVENPWDSDLWVGEVGCVMSITLNSDSSSDSENGSENTSYYYKVSGSSMSTVDGNYYETDKLFNGNPVYKHETNEIYLRKTYQNWQITTSATDPTATALFYTDSTDVSSTWHAVAGTPPTVVLVES